MPPAPFERANEAPANEAPANDASANDAPANDAPANDDGKNDGDPANDGEVANDRSPTPGASNVERAAFPGNDASNRRGDANATSRRDPGGDDRRVSDAPVVPRSDGMTAAPRTTA